MKKIIAALLCAAMLMVVSVGCEDDSESSQRPQPDVTPPIQDQDHDHDQHMDFDAAFLTFRPDTVMIRAGDYTVNWGELFFYLRNNISYLVQSVGDIYDWSAIFEEGLTYSEAVMDAAVENALFYKAVELGAKKSGVALSAENLERIRADFDDMAEKFGGEAAFVGMLWMDEGYYSRELFDYIATTQNLANSLFFALYGENSEKVSDEDTARLTADGEFLMAKHILRLKEGAEDEAAMEAAMEILEQLDTYEGDDFDAFFDEMMHTYSEDPGVEDFPEGYLFRMGDMVTEFYYACLELEIGEYSRIISTEYGYHILLRLPINFDAVPIGGANVEDFRTLRNYTAGMLYESQLYEWKDSLVPQYTEEFNSINLADMFS